METDGEDSTFASFLSLLTLGVKLENSGGLYSLLLPSYFLLV